MMASTTTERRHLRSARFGMAGLLLAGLVMNAPSFAADLGNGTRVYQTRCAGCHGVDGKAINPSAPSFSGTNKPMQPDMALLTRIKTGKKQCPPFFGLLTDKEILDVISYIRVLP